MFDIFSEPEQPNLYIADIEVVALIPSRSKIPTYEKRVIKIDNQPIILLNGNIPSKSVEKKLLSKIHSKYIHKGDFGKIKFKINYIKNIRFSSKLMYHFNYLVD